MMTDGNHQPLAVLSQGFVSNFHQKCPQIGGEDYAFMRRLVCTAEHVETLATQHYHSVNEVISRAITRIKEGVR